MGPARANAPRILRMRRTNRDLMVGGAILLALFVLISGVLWLKEVSIMRRMVSYTVLFPNVGALQIGDPVKVNGVKMGSVASMELQGSQVRVVMRVDQSVQLTDSAVITVQNIGLMGERNVMIQLVDAGGVYPPDGERSSDKPALQGYFDSGIAEAMGMVGTVLGEVRVLVRNVQSILDATVGDTVFVDFFHTVVARLDTVTAIVEQVAVRNRGRINQSLANVHDVTTEIKRLIDDNRGNINMLLANGSELSTQALRIAADVESLSVSLRGIVSTIERGEGTLGMLVEDDRFSTELKETVAKIDTLANDVQDNGLKLRIRLGFRKRRNKGD
jgi:phospholipid/cholesterol/gamma-HCH transport system substrate-binding protein